MKCFKVVLEREISLTVNEKKDIFKTSCVLVNSVTDFGSPYFLSYG